MQVFGVRGCLRVAREREASGRDDYFRGERKRLLIIFSHFPKAMRHRRIANSLAAIATRGSNGQKRAIAWGSLNPNLAPEQCPHETRFFTQKAKPGLTVCDKPQIGRALVALRYSQRLVTNDDCRVQFLLSGKRKVIGCVQSLRFAALE